MPTYGYRPAIVAPASQSILREPKAILVSAPGARLHGLGMQANVACSVSRIHPSGTRLSYQSFLHGSVLELLEAAVSHAAQVVFCRVLAQMITGVDVTRPAAGMM